MMMNLPDMNPSPKRPDPIPRCRRCKTVMGARVMEVPLTRPVMGYWCDACRRFYPLPAKEQTL